MAENPTPTNGKQDTGKDNIYILITQCLQNSFFLEDEVRLCLPRNIVSYMLAGTDDNTTPENTYAKSDLKTPHRRKLYKEKRENGPLYQFFQVLIDDKDRPNHLHVIHVKDWHQPTASYDKERCSYGAHCEAGSWGVEPIEGYEQFLAPWQAEKSTAQRTLTGYKRNDNLNTTFYEVLSDSLFDFSPGPKINDGVAIETILDNIIKGKRAEQRVYVVTIGVYSDIKMMTLLTGLRSRYVIDSLIVSDVLTGSVTLERHLTGIDFINKVLNVEVIHSLNDLVDVLHMGNYTAISPEIIKQNPNFSLYSTYFLDKQNVLAYQNTQLAKYMEMTQKRSTEIYEKMQSISTVMTWFGYVMIGVSIIAAILRFFEPAKYTNDVIFVAGGVGLAAIASLFLYDPLRKVQSSLQNMVQMHTLLESHSMITSLMRHHFTMPEYLTITSSKDKDGKVNLEQALAVLARQNEMLRSTSKTLSDDLNKLIARDEGSKGEGANVSSADTVANLEP